jgi:hypothetical protein
LLFGQGTDLGTIRGTVKDPSGAVIANPKVTATDVETSTSREANANGVDIVDRHCRSRSNSAWRFPA